MCVCGAGSVFSCSSVCHSQKRPLRRLFPRAFQHHHATKRVKRRATLLWHSTDLTRFAHRSSERHTSKKDCADSRRGASGPTRLFGCAAPCSRCGGAAVAPCQRPLRQRGAIRIGGSLKLLVVVMRVDRGRCGCRRCRCVRWRRGRGGHRGGCGVGLLLVICCLLLRTRSGRWRGLCAEAHQRGERRWRRRRPHDGPASAAVVVAEGSLRGVC